MDAPELAQPGGVTRGVAAGVRRVEALTGDNALAYVQGMEKTLGGIAGTLKVVRGEAPARVNALLDQVRRLERELSGLKSMDKLKDKLKSAAIVLATTSAGKVSLIAGVTADLTGRIKAGELVNFVAQQVGGKGGGRPDMAQAGGTDPAPLPAALASVKAWVEAKL